MGNLWSYFSRKQAKPLLILDMNKLLVYRAFAPKLQEEFPQCVSLTDHATLLGQHWTWSRPGLDTFIDSLFKTYTVAVWSSAWAANVDLLCSHVFGTRRANLLFEWDQSWCTKIVPHPDPSETKPLFAKDLQKVWAAYPQYNDRNTLIVDDCKHKMQLNPAQCVILAPPWTPYASSSSLYNLEQLISYAHIRRTM